MLCCRLQNVNVSLASPLGLRVARPTHLFELAQDIQESCALLVARAQVELSYETLQMIDGGRTRICDDLLDCFAPIGKEALEDVASDCKPVSPCESAELVGEMMRGERVVEPRIVELRGEGVQLRVQM